MSGVLAIIPARGGSKGIPHKNVRRSRQAAAGPRHRARAAGPVGDRVVVSTDDAEIADVARRYGAQVVMRPAEISGDAAGSESALLHVLDHLEAAEDYRPDWWSSSRRPPRSAGRARSRRPSTCCGARHRLAPLGLPAPRVRLAGTGAQVESLTYDHRDRPRRQDIGRDFVENGSIYVFRTPVLRESGNRLGGKIALFPDDPLHSFQIDEPGDFELLERLAGLSSTRPARPELAAIRLLVLDFDGVMTDDRVRRPGRGESVTCTGATAGDCPAQGARRGGRGHLHRGQSGRRGPGPEAGPGCPDAPTSARR